VPIEDVFARGYLGDATVKGINQSIEWTPEMLAEYMKCEKDPLYFIETYMRIIQAGKGQVKFVLRDYQREMIKSMHENRFTIIATARQAGKSTAVCAFILWYIVFHSAKTVGMLANKGETAREILGKVRFAYRLLPKWCQQGVATLNKGKLELENDSRVVASATGSGTIRGYTCDILFIDEAAWVEDWDEFYTAVYPTISSSDVTKVIQVSTPNGLNHFHTTWVGANNTDPKKWNGFHPIMVTWRDVPGRDEKWKHDTLAAMNFDQAKFDQEYNVEFQGSSGTLISGPKLKELIASWVAPATPTQKGLTKYSPPLDKHFYIMVCDVSRGKGGDYSAFSVIDVSKMPYDQVCTYRSNMTTPMDYAQLIMNIAKQYNNAAVLVEVNDIGEQVGHALHYDLEYDNVLFTENAGRSGKRISAGWAKGVDKGVRTTKVLKTNGCIILKLMIEQGQLLVNDWSTIDELCTFSLKGNGSYEAEDGKHDDMVMGLVLFAWLSDQQYFRDYTDINTLQKLRDQTDSEIMDDMLFFGFFDDARGESKGALMEGDFDGWEHAGQWMTWD